MDSVVHVCGVGSTLKAAFDGEVALRRMVGRSSSMIAVGGRANGDNLGFTQASSPAKYCKQDGRHQCMKDAFPTDQCQTNAEVVKQTHR